MKTKCLHETQNQYRAQASYCPGSGTCVYSDQAKFAKEQSGSPSVVPNEFAMPALEITDKEQEIQAFKKPQSSH